MDRIGCKLSCVALGMAMVVSGCDRKKDAAPEPSPAPSASAAPRAANDQQDSIRVGDEIVVESGTATFWAAKVVKVDDDKVSYEYGTNRSSGEAEREKVYVVAPNHHTVARAGDAAVCKTDEAWNPCQVKHIHGDVYVVDDAWSKSRELSGSEIVVPNETAQSRIKEKLHKAFQNRDFVQAAKAAGMPRRPEGWTPRPGDEIVAQFTDSSWYGGRIRRLTPTKIHVAWDDKSKTSERDHEQVAPKPEEPQEVRQGQYVLGRPRRGTRWDYYLVESVDDGGVVLVDKEGRKRKVKKSDVIPLGT